MRAPGELAAGLVLALAIAIVAVSRVPSLDVLVWNVDEGVTAAMADVIRDGGLPYRDGVDHRGPATYYAYALIFAGIDGGGEARMFALHVALIALVAFVVLGTFALGALAFDRRTGGLAALLLAGLSLALPPQDTLAFHTEWMLLLFSVPAALCCAWAATRERPAWLVLAGGLLACAFLAKQPAGLELAAAGGFLALRRLFEPGGPRWGPALREVSFLALGFVVVVGSAVACFAVAGAWSDFLLWFWQYNTEIYMPAVPLVERLKGSLAFWDQSLHVYRALGLVVAVGLFTSAYAWLRFSDATPRPTRSFLHIEAYLWLWLAGAYLGASLSGRQFGHYTLPLLPALSVLGAAGLLRLCEAFDRTLWSRRSARRGFAFAVVLVLVAGGVSQRLPQRPESGWPQIWRISSEENAAVQELVEYSARNSTSEDRIFVWGWFGSLYTLTDRLPATRFLYCTFLAGLIPWVNLDDPDTLDQAVPGSWAMFQEDVQRSKPLYVVDTTPGNYARFGKYPPETMPELDRLLRESYSREHVIRLPDGSDYFHLYRRIEGS